MKIAVSSATARAAFRAGTLTHLEWIEACASRLDVDGLVYALADFPRTDPEYAAQAKKVSIDLGLVPVALDAPGLLDPAVADETRDRALTLACSLGVLVVATTTGAAGELPPQTFVTTVDLAKRAAKAAKAANLTIVVAPEPGTIAPDVSEVRHLLKDVDSAWLRYALAYDADRSGLGPRDRVLLERVPVAAQPGGWQARRSWFVLSEEAGTEPFGVLGSIVTLLRR